MQVRNPHYMMFDGFLVTSGPRDFLDTNGEPYVVDHGGMSVSTLAWTFVLFALSVAVAAVIGLALGANRHHRGVLATVAGSLAVGLVILLVAPSLSVANLHSMTWSYSYFLSTVAPASRLLLLATTAAIPLLISVLALVQAMRTTPLPDR